MLDQELRALVSVEPSPDFEARVRTTIAGQAAPRSWLRLWSPMSAAAGSVVIAIVLGHWADSNTFVQDEARSHASNATDRLLPSSGGVADPSPLRLPVAAGTERTAPLPVVVRTTAAHSMVQIDRAEAEALQRLFAAPPAISISVAAAARSASDALEIPELKIAPLTIDAPAEGDSK